MNEASPQPPAWTRDAPDAGAAAAIDWQPLPSRGARLYALSHALGLAVPVAIAATALVLGRWPGLPWWLAPVAVLAALALGGWLGLRRHRRIFWVLDDHGLATRRGHWWQQETRVPISRVQHLDIKRGPLERVLGLATLVVHTAGTRMAAVSVPMLDDGDAERLRERLSQQLDRDDDAL